MKKILLIFLILSCAVFCTLAAACVPKEYASGGHNWSEEWSSDSEFHWHECTDQNCYGINEKAAHDWQLAPDSEQPAEYYKAPKCNETGRGLFVCSFCGAQKIGDIPTTPHRWELVSEIEPATCHSEGLSSYKCADCPTTTTMPVPATGNHNFVQDKWESNAESHWQVCQNVGCGEKGEVLPHIPGEPKITRPSGGNDGKQETLCEICGYVLASEVIPATNVPASFELQMSASLTRDDAGIYYVSLGMDDHRTISFVNIKDASGNALAQAWGCTFEAYVRNEQNGVYTQLGGVEDTSGFGVYCVLSNNGGTIWVSKPGHITVEFRCVSGDGTVRAFVRLYINSPYAPKSADAGQIIYDRRLFTDKKAEEIK